MPYLSLYRKYRSQTFEDVMGQEHVTKTLQNAIRLGKVAHAYLFCGTRGTGKTTTARLLAKAMNCEKGPTPIPCNECPSCTSINEGSAMDIIELDAASHRSIRDIEEIRDNVKFPPMELRYKVFIIDEAHQLSSDAKDAFLKTLEEPPPHAIFILATTEPQSIPVTIRSRCQQFDFRRGSLHDLKARLKYVTDSEGMKADDDALDLMATNADGSWRDALSLLEQVLAYTDGKSSAEDVNTVLGTVTQDFLFRLADTLADGDQIGAFRAAAEAAESGKEIQQLLISVAQHLRNLLFAQVTSDLKDITSNEEVSARLREQASRFSRQSLLRAVGVFAEAEREARFSEQHRLLLELALLKAIEAAHPAERAPALSPSPEPRPAPPKEAAPVEKEIQPPKREAAPKPETEPKTAPESAPLITEPIKQNLPEFDKIEAKWNQVLQHVKSISPVAHGLLSGAIPKEIRNGALVLLFKGVGQKNLLMNEAKPPKGMTKRQVLATALQQVFHVADVNIIGEIRPSDKQAVEDTSEEDLPDPFKDSGQEVLNDVLDIFNGTIVDE